MNKTKKTSLSGFKKVSADKMFKVSGGSNGYAVNAMASYYSFSWYW